MKFKLIVAAAVLFFGIAIGQRLYPSVAYSQKPLKLAGLDGMFDPAADIAQFNGQTVKVPYSGPALAHNNVLGSTTASKRIEVDLTNQRLYAFEDNTKVFDFLISSGKWGRTPTGEFTIWIKLRYTRMEGGSKALHTYYNLPNVPYTMYFANSEIPSWRGYGIHGTYWHSNFGHPMSHGCINMKTEEAEQLYWWANPVVPDGQSSVRSTDDNPGTKVIIYGTAPTE